MKIKKMEKVSRFDLVTSGAYVAISHNGWLGCSLSSVRDGGRPSYLVRPNFNNPEHYLLNMWVVNNFITADIPFQSA